MTLHQQPDMMELNFVPLTLSVMVFSTVYIILPNISTTMNTWQSFELLVKVVLKLYILHDSGI